MLLLTVNCNKQADAVDTTESTFPQQEVALSADDKDFEVNNTDTHRLHIGDFGDEEGARVLTHPKNFEKSEIARDQTTNWNAMYVYKAKAGFTGTETVRIETCKLVQGSVNPLQCVADTIQIQIRVVQ